MAKNDAGRRCYAAAVGGCKGPLSREHFVSNAILKQIQVDGTVNVQGLPLRGTKRRARVGVGSLTARILCEGHNSALSPVDVAGEKFLTEFFKANKELSQGTLMVDTAVAIDGTLVERWLLKFACGLINSGNAGIVGATVNKKPPPLPLLNVLFGMLPLGGDLGLYSTPQGITSSGMKFSLTPTWKNMGADSFQLTGVGMVHYGLQTFLKLVADFPQTEGVDLSKAMFRPDYFQLFRPRTERKARIELKWPTPPRGTGLDVLVVAKSDHSTPSRFGGS